MSRVHALTPALILALRSAAFRPALTDNAAAPNVKSASGGNVDVAYARGVSDGEAQLARRILQAVKA